MTTLQIDGHIQHTQGLISGLIKRHIVHRNGDVYLSRLIELRTQAQEMLRSLFPFREEGRERLGLFGSVQTVIDLHIAAVDRYGFVFGRALVVVVVIVLVGIDTEGVVTCGEDRMAEGIMPNTGRVFLHQRDFLELIRDRLPRHTLLTQIGFGDTVPQLGTSDIDRRAVGDAVFLIPAYGLAVQNLTLMLRSGITEVKHLTGLAFCKEGSITARRRLRDFILHREEVGAVLTGLRVGIDDNAFLLVMHPGRTNGVRRFAHQVIHHMRHGKFECVARQVILIPYDMRDVIAFQFEYQLQVITEVVGTQTKA